jgi:transcription elongation factor GreA
MDTMADKLYMTAEGIQQLKDSLKEMNERRLKVADAIEHARSLGDLKENAEYHSAKEEQAMLHAKIKDVESKLSWAVPIEEADIDTSKAYVGATLRLLNKKTKKEVTWQLVSPAEADMAKGKISTASPVGQALLGKAPGETAVAKVPAGDLQFQVLEITY